MKNNKLTTLAASALLATTTSVSAGDVEVYTGGLVAVKLQV